MIKKDIYTDQLEKLKAKPKRWLVTGAAGFIGSHLVEALLSQGQNVLGVDNFSDGYKENLDEVTCLEKSKQGSFKFIEGDLQNLELCRQICSDIDIVLHQAALGSVPRSITEPINTYGSNVSGFVNILTAAKDAGIRRFVYASSSSVYGDDPVSPKVEGSIGVPLSPYALSKRINEEYADLYSRIYGMECLGLRYFNVFGPRQNPNGAYSAVIPRWFDSIKREESVVIYGDGETSRDFCYVDNVVQANLLAATTTNTLAYGNIFNVGCAQRTTLNDLFHLIRELLYSKKRFDPVYEPFRSGDIRHSLADISRATCLLGYYPQVDLEEGLSRTMCWYV